MSVLVDQSQPVPEIRDSESSLSENLQTIEQRRERYRAKLTDVQKGKGIRLKRFLERKRIYFRGLDELARRKRIEDIDLMHRYFNGDQYGGYNEMGMYEDRRQDGDFAYSINVLNGHVEQAFLQLLKVRPEYKLDPENPNHPTNIVQVSKMCESLAIKDYKRLMKGARQFEIYNTLLAGESPRYLYWAPNPKSPKTATRAKYEREDIQIPGRRECQGCKATVADGAAACPDCNNSYIKTIPPGVAYRDKMVGTHKVMLGENRLHVPHPMSMQRDMSALTPDDSTFLIERSYLDKHVAEYQYQSIIENNQQEGLSPEMQMRYDLERSSTQTDALIGSARGGVSGPGRAAFGGDMANVPFNKIEQERHFLEPSDYGQFLCDVDEPLPNGKTIPAGTLLGDFFPRGMYVLWAGSTIIDVDECIRGRKWSLVQYGRMAGTNAGAGLKKLIPLQDVVNDDFNLSHAVKHTVGHPLTIIDGKAVYELPGAGQILKISKAGTTSVHDLVAQYPGQTMNNADQTQDRVNATMQFIAKTNTVGISAGGAPDMQAAQHTATGIAALEAQAAAGQSGAVDQQMSADEEMIFQILENIQEFCTEEKSPEQFKELVAAWGAEVVQSFFEMNIRQALSVSIAENSDVPQSHAQRTANKLAFGQIAQNLIPVAAQVPWVMQFLSDLADSMGLSFSLVEGSSDRQEAEYRLNKLNAIEERINAKNPMLMGNPEAAAVVMYAMLAKFCAPLITDPETPLEAPAPANGQLPPQDPAAAPDAGAAQPTDPAAASIVSPEPVANPEASAPRILLQNHAAFMDVYKDALFSEQSKSWSEARRFVVIQLWMDHYKAQLVSDSEKSMLQAALVAMLDPNAAADAAKTQEQKIGESLQVTFKDLTPFAKDFVQTNIFGMPHDPDLRAQSEALANGDTPPSEDEKAQAAIKVAEAKANLEAGAKEDTATLDDARAEADHERGIEAKLVDHSQESNEAELDREHDKQQAKVKKPDVNKS